MKKLLLFTFTLCILSLNAQDYSRIDSLLSKWDEGSTPGFSIGVMKGAELIYAKGFGLANLDYDIPNTPETVFRIASTSKQFTAACIILLEKQGLLNLNDTLTKFFPQFPAYANKITINHLLHHTSGMRDYLVLSYLAGMRDSDYYTDKEVMDWLVNQQSLNFAPGSEFNYSNSGYWLLGQIVEKVSGKTLAEYAQENLFGPLEMKNTHFHDNPNIIVKNRATGYTSQGEENFKISETTLPMVGDGGVFTTVSDFSKWVAEFYVQTEFGKDFWNKMLTVGKLNNGASTDYACGLMIDEYKGLQMISHGGAFVGFRSSFHLFPKEKYAVMVFANRNDISPGSIANDLLMLLLKDKVKVQEKKVSRENEKTSEIDLAIQELVQFTGEYELQTGVDFEISIQNDSLNILQKWNNASYKVTPINENSFVIPEATDILFEFSEIKNGKSQLVTVTQAGSATPCKRKSSEDPFEVSLSEYVGSYYSPELLVNYDFLIENDTLKCKIKNSQAVALNPSSNDTFVMNGGVVFKFKRENETVTAFTIDAGRVKGIEFKKE
ncbi:MAG: serine hydrolase domain-containing protein [Vicingaceae bacterium]